LTDSTSPNSYHKRLLAKACPEPDLMYRSNASAFGLSEKAKYVTSRQGLNLDV
jgi:hypothetical protein